MSSLEQTLMKELAAQHAPRYLLAVCDQALLDERQRAWVKSRFDQRAYPLLQDPHWEALFPYSPLLLAAQETTEAGHHALLSAFAAAQIPRHGWIVSAVPGEQLATHLAQAGVARGPQGAAFLLRYFDPRVLPRLSKHADGGWWGALMAPIVSWWVPTSDTRTERWGRVPGLAMTNAAAPSALLVDDKLWQVLVRNPLPLRILAAMERQAPSLFDTPCPGVRLARVEAVITAAKDVGLTRYRDLLDYVFIALAQESPTLEADRHWQHAIRDAASGAGHLGDLYLALGEQKT